jgi:hypothetical protein
MKITLESTSKVVELKTPRGCIIEARVWEGHTESGIPVHCYVTRIAVRDTEDTAQFERELVAHRAPSAEIAAIPMRLIL